MNSKTAIFLGKFQPPHLGHIRTILREYKKYKKFIVGITEDKKFMDNREVKKIFEEIFENYPSIEIFLVKGIVEDSTACLPENVDIVLSGNRKVLELLSSSYKIQFVDRTKGIGYSATELRKINFNTKTLSSEINSNLTMQIMDISKLKPLEKVLPSHLKNIKEMIERDKVIKKPLIVDKEDGIVLDGSHRYAYLMEEGYLQAPVILVDYDDEAIFVGNHLKHRFCKDENFTISKAEVRNRAIHENIYSPRTTRHFFPFRKDDFSLKLSELKRGKKRDISYLIENISNLQEIKINSNYIIEIDEEIKIIQKYLQEQKETKQYLQVQIEMMSNATK